MDYKQHYALWSKDPYFDEQTRAELLALTDEKEIEERFYRLLEVGTGGLRGILGAGTNRINAYTIAYITEGLAKFIDECGEEAKARGVCISYDSRHRSPEFAEITALVLAAHGIKSFVYKTLHPTPMLSFAVRHLNAIAGVMITASHNPSKYNGYKFYGEDGGQMPPESADKVVAYANQTTDFRTLKWLSKEEAIEKGLFHYMDDQVSEDYYKMTLGLSINPEIVKQQKNLKMVYSPLHGAGYVPVKRILTDLGFEQVKIVEAQALPDATFKTVAYPNPEEREALSMAIDLAQKEQADLVIATDPDADRMGAAVRLADGSYQVLTGNQIGLLLMDYILSAKSEKGILPDQSFVATTIVSTRLVHRVAHAFKVKLFEVLTGFKYIGELIKNLDEQGSMHYQFGFEESFGYLAGTQVRDKDAVVASMLLAEMCAVSASKGENLALRLEKLYQKYGYGLEKTVSITLEGMEGIAKINQAIQTLRQNKTAHLNGLTVRAIRDYKTHEKTLFTAEGNTQVETLTLPTSNVLLYELGEDDWVCVRPSGTEPKLKIYAGAYASDESQCQAKLNSLSTRFVEEIKKHL